MKLPADPGPALLLYSPAARRRRRLTRSAARTPFWSSRMVVRTVFPRTAPAKPMRRINRSTAVEVDGFDRGGNRGKRPRHRRFRRPHRCWWSGMWPVYGATVRDRGAGVKQGGRPVLFSGRGARVSW